MDKARKRFLKKQFLKMEEEKANANLSSRDKFARTMGFSSYNDYLDDCNRRGMCLCAKRPAWLDDCELDDEE